MEAQKAVSLANEINVEVSAIMNVYFNNKTDFNLNFSYESGEMFCGL